MSVIVQIAEGPITGSPSMVASGSGSAGGLLVFDGIVRATEDDAPIESLAYTAYRPMADHMLTRLAEQAQSKFGLISFEVLHSVGIVPVGACSLRVTICSKHRGEALDAMHWFIDALKADVPIWKKPVPATAPSEQTKP